MIALSTLTFDIDGHIILDVDAETDFGAMTRRNTRTATLDGDSALSDLGFSFSDMLFNVELSNISNSDLNQLKYLIQTYPELIISTSEGCFQGAMQNLDVNLFPINFTFLPLKKLS